MGRTARQKLVDGGQVCSACPVEGVGDGRRRRAARRRCLVAGEQCDRGNLQLVGEHDLGADAHRVDLDALLAMKLVLGCGLGAGSGHVREAQASLWQVRCAAATPERLAEEAFCTRCPCSDDARATGHRAIGQAVVDHHQVTGQVGFYNGRSSCYAHTAREQQRPDVEGPECCGLGAPWNRCGRWRWGRPWRKSTTPSVGDVETGVRGPTSPNGVRDELPERRVGSRTVRKGAAQDDCGWSERGLHETQNPSPAVSAT